MAVTLEYQNLNNNMTLFKSKFHAAVQILAANGAQKMEAYAKKNAPWRNRTGRARESLAGSWKREGNTYKIQIAHGVSYGVYLEFKNERKYAILMPTVEKVGYGEILPAFKNLVDKVGGF